MKALSSDKLKDISFFSGLNDETLKYIEKNSKVLKRKRESIFLEIKIRFRIFLLF